MEIVHVEKNGNFTWMKNIHLRDRFLSLKAKGLLSVMFSLPKDWDCTITGLAYISKEGISAIRATIKELEAAGYITRERIRNEAGQLKDMKYTIHETPVNREPEEPVPTVEQTFPDDIGSDNLPQDELDLSALPEPASENPTFVSDEDRDVPDIAADELQLLPDALPNGLGRSFFALGQVQERLSRNL